MVTLLDSIDTTVDKVDAIVLDQWGVLHDGTTPYPNAQETVRRLHEAGTRLAVLSNSGKRSAPNRARIAAMGFPAEMFDVVMTSGEALFTTFAQDLTALHHLYPICAKPQDALDWAKGLNLAMVDSLDAADAVLLMGLPDGSAFESYKPLLDQAHARNLPMYCSNPDLTSPRAGGQLVLSPGALAQAYGDLGGDVHLYGKPHLPIYRAMEQALGVAPERLLMVGDSLHHDIQGATRAGWQSLLIRGGILADVFAPLDETAMLQAISDQAALAHTSPPTYSLKDLS